ncbi:hypothetical protein TrLO_g1381 [Triparma laevis f. longispina]|uniref:PAS domain-containing protein n=1 Tax=Triparma laevis f. longispina TaxID=1714387 RepID=A0A9W7FTX2_9STRA|nr:hypothetical protein TrLO_g1381 [Triparma laevis f. longispina]
MTEQGSNAFNMLASLCGAENATANTPGEMGGDEKEKRAANRRSAQLSRKRKKQAIENLKEENLDLKKRVHILRHVPNLVIVFNVDPLTIDFASDAASEMLGKAANEMEGDCIWDYMDRKSKDILTEAISKSVAGFASKETKTTTKCTKPTINVMSSPNVTHEIEGYELEDDEEPYFSIPLQSTYDLSLLMANGQFVKVSVQGACSFSGKTCSQCVLSIMPCMAGAEAAAAATTDESTLREQNRDGRTHSSNSSTSSSGVVHCISDVDTSSSNGLHGNKLKHEVTHFTTSNCNSNLSQTTINQTDSNVELSQHQNDSNVD